MQDNVLETPRFRVHYDEASHTLQFEGDIRLLRSVLADKFAALLSRSLDFQTSFVVWDLRQLRFLDSTAEHGLYAALAKVRGKGNLVVRIQANDDVRIQQKLVPNLKQFFPRADVYYQP